METRTEPVAPGVRRTFTSGVDPAVPGVTVTLSPVIRVTVAGVRLVLPVAADGAAVSDGEGASAPCAVP
ncbi:hypothetical protein GCM10014715_55560 [Streptomyces spiralis]|uniref:Uncharacterized protein n=1 Tax=Streptomyces spiralis TaxID=66376 RepID=A0A919A8F6_9ACTN|nr:hypothetical protein GCM10014715_55560 [Streptomyces spiralis]